MLQTCPNQYEESWTGACLPTCCMRHGYPIGTQCTVCAGLTDGEKEEKARAKEALHSDGEGSDDEGDTRKAATYGTKKNEVLRS